MILEFKSVNDKMKKDEKMETLKIMYEEMLARD